jgi:hypothetical protein
MAIELFKIEDGVPVPSRGGRKASEAIQKLTYALNNMRPGQSIVFSGMSLTGARHRMKKDHPDLDLVFTVIDKEKGWIRMHLLGKINTSNNGVKHPK